MNQPSGPVTFGHLRENGQWLHLYCTACGYEREVDTTTPPWSGMPDATVVPTLGKRMRCTRCKVKGNIWSVPESRLEMASRTRSTSVASARRS